ncbi:hypothetical protein AO716_03255 [Arthrobacter sp. Edens01]|nr:hypothetical protein AO716_03255 [Arthrobacter sp. Edens01]
MYRLTDMTEDGMEDQELGTGVTSQFRWLTRKHNDVRSSRMLEVEHHLTLHHIPWPPMGPTETNSNL